jgi:hypothetical protein
MQAGNAEVKHAAHSCGSSPGDAPGRGPQAAAWPGRAVQGGAARAKRRDGGVGRE